MKVKEENAKLKEENARLINESIKLQNNRQPNKAEQDFNGQSRDHSKLSKQFYVLISHLQSLA